MKIIIKDPLYKQIIVDEKYLGVLNSREFQRLRYIKQISFTDFVFPSATHTRFTHSLGAYYLMNKVINNGLMDVSDKEKDELLAASLLHDIGHGPFSHVWEKIFPSFDHEESTKKIMKSMGFKDSVSVIEGRHRYSKLLSSVIDVDKMDYMVRDSYFAGVSYGFSEVDFIIENMFIRDDKVIVNRNALSSIEDLITQRQNLYKTVYFHKYSVLYDFLLEKILFRVKELIEGGENIYVNEHLKRFFFGKNDIEDLLYLNDFIVLSHIYEWKDSGDKILRDLCSAFVDKNRFKVVVIDKDNENYVLKKKYELKDYDLKYYFGIIDIRKRIVQGELYINMYSDVKSVFEVSDLLRFFKDKFIEIKFLVYFKG